MTVATPSRQTPPQRRAVHKIVTGDRICVRCGYNLFGQEIFREEHYSMLVVRCPECATVASVQDNPLVSRWAARWGAVLAALWFVVLLALWPATSAMIFGFSMAITEEVARDYERHLSDLQAAAQPPGQPANAPSRTVNVRGGTVQFFSSGGSFEKWWLGQDPKALLADAGGWRAAVNAGPFLILIPAGLVIFLVACLWSVFLLQIRRRWLVIPGAAIIVLACFFATFTVLEWTTLAPAWPGMAARQQLGPPALATCIGSLVIPLSLGFAFGRPLVRLLIRALLPPRLRASLVLLWTAEGLNPPSPRTN